MIMPNKLDTVALVAAVASVLWVAPPAAAQETIKLGYSPQIHDAAVLEIKRDLGVRYKLEYTKFLRYTDTQIALSRGDIDLGSLGYASAVVAALRDDAPKFVYVAGLARGAINLVCRRDVVVKTWDDLKGKVFGVLTGGPAELFFVDALRSHGVVQNEVKTVTFAAPGPPLLQALQSGAIQCTAIFEPLAASAVADGIAYYPAIDLADNSFFGINHGLAVNVEFLAKHPDFVQEAVDSVVRSTLLYTKDHKQWINDMAATGEFKENAIAVGVDHLLLDNNLYVVRLDQLAAAMSQAGFIKEAPAGGKLASYFVYDFLQKTTNRSPDALGRNKQ
jgi:ABC-type nitrate/sulfonate/bicarbonate transport system substrate-binding protein